MPMNWTTVQNNAAEYFGQLVRGFPPDPQGKRDAVLNLSWDSRAQYVGPIDWTWGTDDFIGRTLDNDEVKLAYATRCNQVEILIREAERALGDVLKYDDLNVERFKVMMEFVEFNKTWGQQQVEQGDGDYWNGLENEAALSSQARMSAISADAETAYKNAKLDYGWLRENLGYTDVSRKWYGAEESTAWGAYEQAVSQNKASNGDADSHDARKKYEHQARVHQQERQANAREIIGIKLNELQRGGALDYNGRMQAIGERAFYDFKEVYGRLNAIAIGLREFYSVTNLPDIGNELTRARTRVEGAVNWLRRANNALAFARMDEQEYVVRKTIERGGLLNELKSNHGVVWSFPDTMRSAQLKGISATAEPLAGDSWIALEVTSPEQTLASVPYTLPPVTARLDRVSSSASLNVRDVAGGRPIVNRSPVGSAPSQWRVRAIDADSRVHAITQLHLDFHLAFSRQP
jgi:hypothetical protein